MNKIVNGLKIIKSKTYPNYGVSVCGRAFRLDSGKEMKVGLLTGSEYPVFRVSHGGVSGWAYLHKVLMECWVENPNPSLFLEVNHKDGVKTNYSIENLEWVSISQNQRHAINTGLKSKGQDLYNSTLTDTLAHIVCQELQDGCRPNDIARKHEISPHVVRKLRDGSTYFHIRSLYPIDHKFRNHFSEPTVCWVCEKIVAGLSDKSISEMSSNKKMTVIEVKRIRSKIRYTTISNDYF